MSAACSGLSKSSAMRSNLSTMWSSIKKAKPFALWRLSEDEQWRKLEVMLETARRVWG